MVLVGRAPSPPQAGTPCTIPGCSQPWTLAGMGQPHSPGHGSPIAVEAGKAASKAPLAAPTQLPRLQGDTRGCTLPNCHRGTRPSLPALTAHSPRSAATLTHGVPARFPPRTPTEAGSRAAARRDFGVLCADRRPPPAPRRGRGHRLPPATSCAATAAGSRARASAYSRSAGAMAERAGTGGGPAAM